MAGRPRKKAERVTVLEEESLALHMGMFSECPRQYRERPDDDELSRAWSDALDATGLADTAMQKLGGMLRKKAKITEPGPFEAINIADGDAYEPIPDDWSLVSACTGVAKRRAELEPSPPGRNGTAQQGLGVG